MNELFGKVEGYFKIEVIDINGNVTDTFEKKNLIMDKARVTFAKYLAGINGIPIINRFVIGTKGHIGADDVDGGDILAPKTETQGFTSDREMLFSEESGNENTEFESISFTNTGVSGGTVVCDDGLSTVKTTVQGSDVIYEILVDAGSANGTGTIIFTECAFYTGSEIFSMRTFKGKIKDDSVSLRITWKILF